ncbi:MAG: trypsin-like peptidase domain-containing protein [Clostridia bacterium]|nr:trypsin-like peptidase domain-containing protein [Clostridia bacterium]
MATQNPFALAYKTAREFAIAKNPKGCREQLYKCLGYLLDTLPMCKTIVDKAKCRSTIDQIKSVISILSSNGINEEVCAFFKISIVSTPPSEPVGKSVKITPPSESTPRPTTPVTPKPTPTQPVATSPKVETPVEPVVAPPISSTPKGDSVGTAPIRPISVPPIVTPKAPEALVPPVMPRADQEWSEAVYDKSIRGVVTVHVPGGAGTGFIISDKGFLLTNHHVVVADKYKNQFHDEIYMCFSDSRRMYELKFIDADETYDVALCRFTPSSLPSFATLPLIPDYSTLRPGAAVVLIGNPVSQGIAPFTGTVSYTCNNCGDLVFSAPSNPGCSGGPVLDRNGYVVGINKSLTVSVNGVKTQGFTNATPMNQVKKLLDEWKKKHNLSF